MLTVKACYIIPLQAQINHLSSTHANGPVPPHELGNAPGLLMGKERFTETDCLSPSRQSC